MLQFAVFIIVSDCGPVEQFKILNSCLILQNKVLARTRTEKQDDQDRERYVERFVSWVYTRSNKITTDFVFRFEFLNQSQTQNPLLVKKRIYPKNDNFLQWVK